MNSWFNRLLWVPRVDEKVVKRFAPLWIFLRAVFFTLINSTIWYFTITEIVFLYLNIKPLNRLNKRVLFYFRIFLWCNFKTVSPRPFSLSLHIAIILVKHNILFSAISRNGFIVPSKFHWVWVIVSNIFHPQLVNSWQFY